jgi:tetratricopeptide (TPR) repeat protein
MTRRSLGILFGLALALRLAVLAELRGTLLVEVLVGDGKAFDAWGREIAAGDWLGRDVFYQAPLYPYFLGLVHALGGDAWVARVVQAVLGAAACTLVARTTATLLDRRAGWVAGLLAAAYAPWIWFDVTIQKGSLALALAALAFAALAALVVRGGPGGRGAAALLGAALGLLALVNENALALAAGVALALLCLRARRHALAPYLAALALVLVPVALRNAALGGTFLPTASNFGVNFWIGNGAEADGLYTPLVIGRGHPDYEQEDARAGAERETGRSLTPTEVSLHWLRRGWRELRADPARALALYARKTRLVLARPEIMDAEALELHADHSRVLAFLWKGANFALLFPLAVLGLACARKEERARLLPAALAALVLAASLLPFFVVGRLRAPAVPFLVPCAAFGALELVRRLRAPGERRGLLLPLAGALAALALALFPPRLEGSPRATALGALASELLRRGDAARALEAAEAAVEADPGDAPAVFNLGVAAKELGRAELAEENLLRAAELEPAYASDALRYVGQMHAVSGDLQAGLELLLRAVERDPENAAAHHDLGRVRELRGELDEAERSYRRALELDPESALSRDALARLRQSERTAP